MLSGLSDRLGIISRTVLHSGMTPEQEQAERAVIFGMIQALEAISQAGHSDWQVLTSFIANLLIDQDNPQKMLRQLTDDVRLKLQMMRKMTAH